MSKNKRSQAAMEFLMTHGWALLIVVIVISILAVFIFSYINKNKGVGCTFEPGITYMDHTYKSGVLTLLIKNSLDKDIELNKIESYGCSPVRIFTAGNSLPAGTNIKIIMGCARFNGDLNIYYKTKDNNLDHTNKGKCDSTTTNPVEISEAYTNCSNANNAELCDALVPMSPAKNICITNYNGLCS